MARSDPDPQACVNSSLIRRESCRFSAEAARSNETRTSSLARNVYIQVDMDLLKSDKSGFDRLDFDRLWGRTTRDEAFHATPRDATAADGGSSEREALRVLVVAGILIIVGLTAVVFGSRMLALISAFGGACLLGPLAILHERKNHRASRELLSAIRECEVERREVEYGRVELEQQTAALETRAAKVEEQYQVLCGLTAERSSQRSPPDGVEVVDPNREELESALEAAQTELRRREEDEKALADRVSELNTARSRAEQELARLMGESHTQLMTEREVTAAERRIEAARIEACEILEQAEEDGRTRAGAVLEQAAEQARFQARELVKQAEEEALAQAREFVEQMEDEAQTRVREILIQAEEGARTQSRELLRQARIEARTQARELLHQAEEEASRIAARGESELESFRSKVELRELAEKGIEEEPLREARSQARKLVERAGEKADRLAAQGKAEFESILREIQQQEQVEKELYKRIQTLEARKSEAELALLRNGSVSDRSRVDPKPVIPELTLLVDPPADGVLGSIRNAVVGLWRRGSLTGQ